MQCCNRFDEMIQKDSKWNLDVLVKIAVTPV